MPHFVKEVIFPLADSQKAALQVEGVTRLTCEDYQCPLEVPKTDSAMAEAPSVAEQALEKLVDQQPETEDTPPCIPAKSTG